MNIARITFTLNALLAGFCLCGCSMQGDSAFNRPVTDSAVNIDSAGIASAPDAPEPDINPMTYYRAARFHESVGRYDDAIEQYRAAIAADPKFAAAYDRSGNLLGYLGKHDEAEKALRRAVDLKPNDAAIRNNLGFELILRKNWQQAERELRRATMLDARLDRAHINLGVALAAQQRFDESLAEFRRVLPEPDAQYNMGVAYRTLRRYDDAKAAFQRVLEINPAFEAAKTQLTSLESLSGNAPTPTDARLAAEKETTDVQTVETDGTLTIQAKPLNIPTPLAFFGADDEENPRPRRPASSAKPGDFDLDGDVDLNDFAQFQNCMTEPGLAVKPNCAAGDFDHDQDVDLADYHVFQSLLANP